MSWLAGRRAWARRVRAGVRPALRVRAAPAVRAAVAVGIPLVALVLLGRPAEAGFAGMGALAGIHVPTAPYRYRATVVALIAVMLAGGSFVGAVVGGHWWLAALVSGAYAAAVSLVAQAVELPPPREVIIVMVLLASTDIPAGPGQALQRAGWTALGAGVAWLVTMSPALLRGISPQRRLAAAAVDAVADLVAAIGTAELPGQRHTAVVAVRAAMAAVAQSGRRHGPLASRMVQLDRTVQAALLVALADRQLPPAWAQAIRAQRFSPSPVTAPAATTDREAALAAAIARLAADEPADVVTPPWGGLRERLLAALGPHTLIGPSAARIGIAVLIGVGLGRALGLSHAYWIGLTATAVLQGSNFSHVRGRFVSRVAGTVAGVALAFALLAAHPSLLVVAVIAALLQVYIEVLVVVSYGRRWPTLSSCGPDERRCGMMDN